MAKIEVSTGSEISGKIGARTAAAIGAGRTGLMDTKTLQETVKQFEKMDKLFKSMGMSVDKMGKAWDKGMIKGLKDGLQHADRFEKAMKRMYTDTVRMQKLQEGFSGARGTTKMYQLAGRYESRGYDPAEAIAMARSDVNAKAAAYGQGADQLQQAMMQQAQQKIEMDQQAQQSKWLNRARYAQMAGVAINFGTQVAQNALNIEGSTLSNQAAGRSFGNSLYHKLASGSGESIVEAAMLLRHLPKVQSITESAVTANIVGNVGGVAAGGAQIGAGIAMGAAAPVSGGATLMAAGPAMAAGGSQVVGSVTGLITEQEKQAAAQAALGALQSSTALDKQSHVRALAWAGGAARQWATREMTGLGSVLQHGELTGITAQAGMDEAATIALQDQLAARYGRRATIGGLDRDVSALAAGMGADFQRTTGLTAGVGANLSAALMSASRGFSGDPVSNKERSNEEMARVIARGYVLGIKDPGVRDSMMQMVADAAVNGAQGIGNRSTVGNLVDYAMMGTRPEWGAQGQMAALSSLESQNRFMQQAGGYYGARSFQVAGNVMRNAGLAVGNNAGFIQNALATADFGTLAAGSPAIAALMGSQPDAAEKAQKLVQNTVRGRLEDMGTDVPAIRARLIELKKQGMTDEQAWNQIRTGKTGADEEARAGGAYWLQSVGGAKDWNEGVSQFSRLAGIAGGLTPKQLTEEEKANAAKEQTPDLSATARIGLEQIKFASQAIGDATKLVSKDLELIATGFTALKDTLHDSAHTAEALDKVAESLKKIRTEAEQWRTLHPTG